MNNALCNNLIAFRVDASIETGLGHFFRIDRLASVFLNHGWSVMVLLKSKENLTFPESRIQVIQIQADSLTEETDEIINICLKNSIQHLLFDISHYKNVHVLSDRLVDSFKRIQEKVKFLHCIDDFKMFPFEFFHHFVPYWEAGRNQLINFPATKYHFGTKYFVLDHQEGEDELIRDFLKPFHIFICFGGSDLHRATIKALQLIDHLNSTDYTLTVNIGKFFANDHVKLIKKYAETNDKTKIIFEGDILSEMRKADLAFLSGGLTKYEACYFGVPQIIIPQFKEEEERMASYSDAGTSIILDNVKSFHMDKNSEKLKKIMKNPMVLKEMSLKARKTIDGLGAKRIFQIISGEGMID